MFFLKVELANRFPLVNRLQIMGRGSTAPRKAFELVQVRGEECHGQ